MNLVAFLKSYVFKIFDIREDELNKTLLLLLHIFLIITSLLVVKPTINSLFLSELTSQALPLGYVLTAITAVVGSYFYNKALEKRPLNKIIEETLIGSILSLILFGLSFKFNLANGILLYIPYVWVAIFGLLTASQFWILANLVYNIREAKRVFGFIGAGAIAGGIFGGYITSLLTKILAAEDLLFVASFLLFFCIPIARYIWKTEVVKLNSFQISIRTDSEAKHPLKLIRQSKLLSLIAVVIGISVLIAKLVDYQYSDYASRLIEDPEDLASFFGFWFSNLSIASLLIQLFLTKRIVGILGVGKSLLWLPSGILFGSVLLLILPQLWVVVLIKLVDGSLKQSVNKAATELLSIPIPIDIKKRTKTFIDVVVDSIATGLAGFILIFFINGLKISSTYVSLIIIALISVWIYFIFQLRKEYINSFKDLFLTSDNYKKKEKKTDIPITSIVDTVNKVLLNGTEEQILYMLQKTLEAKDERFFFAIKELLSHASPKVRANAIENLYFLSTENLSDIIEPMVHEPDQEVTTAAFRYLVKNYKNDTVKLFDRYLSSDDQTITNAALIGLSFELRNHNKLQENYNFEQKLKKAIEQWNDLDDVSHKKNKLIAILEAIGNAKVKEYYALIKRHLSDPDTEILIAAIKSASKTLDQDFIPDIVEHLSRKDIRKFAVESLIHYGELIIDILVNDVKKGEFKSEDAQYVPLVIESFATQNAIKGLMKLTDKTEHIVRIEAIESLRKLKWSHPHLQIKDKLVVNKILDECALYQNTLSVLHSQIVLQYKRKDQKLESNEETEARQGLIRLLENRLDRQLHRIFKFLGMKYLPSDIDPVLDIILTGKEEQRVHAIEFLDNILNPNLKSVLIPIIEATVLDTSSKEVIEMISKNRLSEYECFDNILKGKDLKLKLAVLYLIEQEADKKNLPLLQDLLDSGDPKIKSYSEKAYTAITS